MKNMEKLNHKIVRYKHQQLLNSYYGFNIDEVSQQNLHHLRQTLQHLSIPEKIIFEKLIRSFTLKHATNAAKEILETGKMCSVRALEKEGKLLVSHSSGKDGHDQSIFFVFGLGNHKTPKFIESASHEVTIDLYQLLQKNPDAARQLWVSTHLSEFQCQRSYIYVIGGVKLHIKHTEDKVKHYTISYPDGSTTAFKADYQDEIFTGYDVPAGIAFKFLHLLRLLGGDNNPVVNKLYHSANAQSEEFMPLLEATFSSLMPGDVYPETKIIKELTIDPAYFQIKKKSVSNTLDWQYMAILTAMENFNVENLKLLLQRGYPCYVPYWNIIEEFLKIKKFPSREIKFALLNLILENYYDPDPSCMNLKSAIMFAAGEEGLAEDLDFLLSHQIAHSPGSDIYFLPTIDNEYMHTNKRYDLVSIICNNQQETTKKLEVMQRHGADFQTNAYNYYLTALYTNSRRKDPNFSAILFFSKLGIKPIATELTYNETPLMLACKTKDVYLVRLLVEKLGVDINEPLRFRYISPLGFTHYLDPSNGKTALDFARESNAEDVIHYLEGRGAQPGVCTTTPTGKSENKLFRVVPILVGVRSDNKPYVVLGKRRAGDNNTILTDAYCFPGGEVDDTDNSFEDAAIRELFEETSVDVQKIPNAKIVQLATIDGFSDPSHKATIFYLIDVGSHPITVEASDDLLEAKRVTLDQIQVKEASSIAKFMTLDDTRVLGSNALLIQYCLFHDQAKLSVEQLEQLKKQVLVEAQGCDELVQLLQNNQSDIFPGSETWNKAEALLENLAHLGYKYIPDDSLALLMLSANSFEGIELLKNYQVDISSHYGLLRLADNKFVFSGTALEYAIQHHDLILAKKLVALEPGLIGTRLGSNNALLIQCVKSGLYQSVDYFLKLGIDPNTSQFHETRRQEYSYVQRPLIANAIKGASIDLVQQLLADGRIFINRERSVGDKNTALMTAIKHNKKEIALLLLRDGRLDLSVANAKNYTALKMAKNKADWDDVVKLIVLGLEEQSQITLKNALIKKTQKQLDISHAAEILSNVDFYTQLIRECSSLETIRFDFEQSSITELMGLIHGAKDQDSIQTVYFASHDPISLDYLPEAIETAKSLKSLKLLHCVNTPLDQLKLILNAPFEKVKSMIIHGIYTLAEMEEVLAFITEIKLQSELTFVDMDSDQQHQINLVVTQNQMEQLNITDSVEIDQLIEDKTPSLNLQTKLNLMSGRPTIVKLSSEFYHLYKTYVVRFLAENKQIESITLSDEWNADSATEFLSLLAERNQLRHLSLFSVQINESVLSVLCSLLNSLPIQALQLGYSKFLVSPDLFIKTVNQHQHLVFLETSSLRDVATEIIQGILENQSLLSVNGFGFDYFDSLRGLKTRLNARLVQNAQLQIQMKAPQSVDQDPASYAKTSSLWMFSPANTVLASEMSRNSELTPNQQFG